MTKSTLVPAILLGFGCITFAQPYPETVPSGASITVRTNDAIDLRNSSDGRIFTGVIDRDVRDNSGGVAIPRGANAELIVRNLGQNDMAVDLESVTVGGQRYVVRASEEQYNRSGSRDDRIGKNERTGKYVGGGALLGTIIGAVAGGGKGAAIGAVAGGAAGAGTQVMTRGHDVRVPSESLLTFRLERPLAVGRGEYSRDNGYSQEGRHYHYRQ
jgi:hypothetical protein